MILRTHAGDRLLRHHDSKFAIGVGVVVFILSCGLDFIDRTSEYDGQFSHGLTRYRRYKRRRPYNPAFSILNAIVAGVVMGGLV